MIPAFGRSDVELDRTDERAFRVVGALHLGLATVVNVAVGLGLVYLGSTGRLVRLAFAELPSLATEHAVLRAADTIVAGATTGVVLVGVIFAGLGVGAGFVAYSAFRGRRARLWTPASLGSAINPLAAPLGLIAAILLWLGRPG